VKNTVLNFQLFTGVITNRVSVGITANVLRLGVCYFALQILQALDKFNRQNNSTKPLLVAGAV